MEATEDFNVVPDPSFDRLPSRGLCHTFDDNILYMVTNVSQYDHWGLKINKSHCNSIHLI